MSREIFEYLRDHVQISVSEDTELDYYTEYRIISVSMRIQDPDTQEWIEIGEDSTSFVIDDSE